MHILVSCPDCGEMHVEPQEVTIRTCIDDGSVTYRFRCRHCGRPYVGRTGPKSAGRTIIWGAHFEAWAYPLELAERPGGPPLCEDDLRRLCARMADDNWLAELADHPGGDAT
jgi:hypothetical protein